jgi:O-glycosyl hydrolase
LHSIFNEVILVRKAIAAGIAAALLVTAFLSVNMISVAFAKDPDVYDITLESGVEYQTITGWGVFPASVPAESNHIWFNAIQAHKALFTDLGINIYRIELRGNCGNADGSLVEIPMAAFRKTVKLAKNYKQENYLITIWTPPAGMKSNNNISGKNGDGTAARLLQNKESAFCDYIINVLKDLGSENLPLPSAFSIQNEPNNAFDYQSCYYDKEQYKRVTILMREALDAEGYSGIKLVGPEAPQYKDSHMWLGDGFSELTGDNEYAKALDILASHSYLNKSSTKKADIEEFISNAQKFPDK